MGHLIHEFLFSIDWICKLAINNSFRPDLTTVELTYRHAMQFICGMHGIRQVDL